MKQLLALSFISVLFTACSNEQLAPKTELSVFNFEEPSHLNYIFIKLNVGFNSQERKNTTDKISKLKSEQYPDLRISTLKQPTENSCIILIRSFEDEQQAEEFKSIVENTLPDIEAIETITQNNYKKMLTISSVEQYLKEKKADR